ncbi:hypothetical protein BC835DRAFT_1470947 [Cytidiella melzeri]|nr:hypothetical protein BC835DRAFT_1470947 [Cytidiella melzeri]
MSLIPSEHVHKDKPGHLTLKLPSRSSPLPDPDGSVDPSDSPGLSPSSPPSRHARSSTINSDHSSAGVHRPRSMSKSQEKASSSDAKEKRKRSRVTPEQLAHLERFFATDRSPTAAKRREISELLGMQERQTQIWFQNRRAKAKLFDGKQDQDIAGFPLDAPPPLAAGFDSELNALVHENEPIVVIPCTELSVGTWRRVASTISKYDLVAYVCDRKRTLTWFIHTGGQSFKMVVPFETIIDTKFAAASPGIGQASFALSQPPMFYTEAIDPAGSVAGKVWKRGTDWTEGMQATKILRHDLVGAAIQLAHVLRLIAASTVGPGVSLYHPTHPLDPSSSLNVLTPSSGLVGIAGESQPSPSQPLPYGFNAQQPFLTRRPSLMYSDPATSPSSMGSAPFRSPSSASSTASSFSSPLYGHFPPAAVGSSSSPSLPYPDRPLRSSPDEMHHVAISQMASRRSLADLHSHGHPTFAASPTASLPPSSWHENKRPSSSSGSSYAYYQNPSPTDSGTLFYPLT